jgi:hypothetical protein
MDIEPNYNRLASDCLKIAKRAYDPATRADMARLARLWARLAKQVKKRGVPQADQGHAAGAIVVGRKRQLVHRNRFWSGR